MKQIQGLLVAIPTPFDDKDHIDFDYVVRHLEFIRDRGADGVVASGTNGEASSMSVDERMELIKVAVRHKGDLSVVAGTGCTSLLETIRLTHAAEKSGADAVMVVPPFFFRNATVDGLVSFYSSVLECTSLPVFLYNIPAFSGIEIKKDLVERLLIFDNFVGIKDSSGDAACTRRYIDSFPTLRVFYGADRIIRQMARSGACGAISGIANCFPELISWTMSECESGGGQEMQEKVDRLTYILDRYPLFASNKFILSLKGFAYTHVRPPLVDLSEDEKVKLADELQSGGYI